MTIRANDPPDYRLEPPDPPKYLCCPACGSEMYDYVIADIDGDIVGCSECTRQLDADEYLREESDDDGAW